MADSKLDVGQDAEAARVFRTTHWSVVLAAGDQTSPQASEALTRLCQTYWFPIYAFIRKLGHPPDQAQDLTQGFFASFLEKNSFAKAARERGRFRSFLITSVQNFDPRRNCHPGNLPSEACQAHRVANRSPVGGKNLIDRETANLQ